MAEIVVSLANEEQREECYRLAYEIFCGEMGTMREDADHERGLLRDDAIEAAHVLHGQVDGELSGTMGILMGRDDRPFPEHFEHGFEISRFLSVVPRSQMAINIRFLVRTEHRSSQLPFRLMAEAARFQCGNGIKLVFCDCQPHLLNLYQGIGFRPYADVFEQPGFGVMVPLVLIVPDVAHIRAIRSPMIRYSKGIEDPALAEQIRALLPEHPPVVTTTDLERAAWAQTVGLLSQPRERTGAFEGFSEDEVKVFLDRAQVLECVDGQQIVVRGHGTRSAYIVMEGVVEVRLNDKLLARIGEGELFGEFALLLATKRTADVFAKGERVKLLVLDERTLQRLLAGQAELAAKFLLNLSKSLALRLINPSNGR
jgi:predicted GNAT family N-acyltransferase